MAIYLRITRVCQQLNISRLSIFSQRNLSDSAEDFVASIKKKLTNALQPDFIEVINESARHNVPKGSASHIRVAIVSPLFNGKRLVQRHRLVNDVLVEELKGPIHALSIDAVSSSEINGKLETKESPPCKGGAGL